MAYKRGSRSKGAPKTATTSRDKVAKKAPRRGSKASTPKIPVHIAERLQELWPGEDPEAILSAKAAQSLARRKAEEPRTWRRHDVPEAVVRIMAELRLAEKRVAKRSSAQTIYLQALQQHEALQQYEAVQQPDDPEAILRNARKLRREATKTKQSPTHEPSTQGTPKTAHEPFPVMPSKLPVQALRPYLSRASRMEVLRKMQRELNVLHGAVQDKRRDLTRDKQTDKFILKANDRWRDALGDALELTDASPGHASQSKEQEPYFKHIFPVQPLRDETKNPRSAKFGMRSTFPRAISKEQELLDELDFNIIRKIDRFCEDLELPVEVVRATRRIHGVVLEALRVKDKKTMVNLHALAAGSLFRACEETGNKRAFREIHRVTGDGKIDISRWLKTIDKHYKETKDPFEDRDRERRSTAPTPEEGLATKSLTHSLDIRTIEDVITTLKDIETIIKSQVLAQKKLSCSATEGWQAFLEIVTRELNFAYLIDIGLLQYQEFIRLTSLLLVQDLHLIAEQEYIATEKGILRRLRANAARLDRFYKTNILVWEAKPRKKDITELQNAAGSDDLEPDFVLNLDWDDKHLATHSIAVNDVHEKGSFVYRDHEPPKIKLPKTSDNINRPAGYIDLAFRPKINPDENEPAELGVTFIPHTGFDNIKQQAVQPNTASEPARSAQETQVRYSPRKSGKEGEDGFFTNC